jgi:hypothetical protein
MTTFREALDRLAQLTVSGVAASFGVDSVPDTLHRGQLPALLALPIRTEADSQTLFADRGGGFEAVAFENGPRTVTYTVTHLLIVAPESAGSGLRSHLPALIARIDAYLHALAADVTLNGAMVEPARVRVEPGVFEYGDVAYVGCAFRHTWVMDIEAAS